MKRIAIIGGGISGVAAAWQLARLQKPSVLFEASGRLGGTVETERRDGFIIECGPDSWVSEKPWARELAVELGLEPEIIGSNDQWRRTYLVRDGKLVAMPEGMRMMVPAKWGPLLDSPLFSWQAKLAYLREPKRAEELKASAVSESEDESVASFVRRHFGDEVTGTMAAPLLAGVFGGSIDRLSARAVMGQFIKMEQEHGSLISALQNRESRSPGAIFTTLRSGLGTLIDHVSAGLAPGAVRLDQPVVRLARNGAQWRVTTTSEAEIFDAVIMATPAHVTRQLLAPLDARFEALLAMEATSAIVVALAFQSEKARTLRIPRGFGFLDPSSNANPASERSLLACTFVDQKFDHRAPTGGVLLRGFFGGDVAPALLSESDEFLTALAGRGLSRLLGPLPAPDISIVRRWPFSLPQYAVGHLGRIAQTAALVGSFAGLRLIGNAYYGVGLPDLVREARDAASSLAAFDGSRGPC